MTIDLPESVSDQEITVKLKTLGLWEWHSFTPPLPDSIDYEDKLTVTTYLTIGVGAPENDNEFIDLVSYVKRIINSNLEPSYLAFGNGIDFTKKGHKKCDVFPTRATRFRSTTWDLEWLPFRFQLESLTFHIPRRLEPQYLTPVPHSLHSDHGLSFHFDSCRNRGYQCWHFRDSVPGILLWW